jgi:hypothetical protein
MERRGGDSLTARFKEEVMEKQPLWGLDEGEEASKNTQPLHIHP